MIFLSPSLFLAVNPWMWGQRRRQYSKIGCILTSVRWRVWVTERPIMGKYKYRKTYVKEASADAITCPLGAYIKTLHLLKWNYFPSFLATNSAPSSFVIYHEVLHCLCRPFYSRYCSFCHLLRRLRPRYQCQTFCIWFAVSSTSRPPRSQRNTYLRYVNVLLTIPLAFLFTASQVLPKVLPPASLTPATADLSNAVSLSWFISITTVGWTFI